MPQLIQKLPDGPLDIIGDVHGELGALERLLRRLGCDPATGHVERPLVFLGDLIDRGPDSVGVCRLVRSLCQRGVAHCIVGNHELNVLRADEKEGNGWILGHPDGFHLNGELRPFESSRCDRSEADELIAWMGTLPIAMTRPDLRVVHACWLDELAHSLPPSGDLAALCRIADQEIRDALDEDDVARLANAERGEFGNLIDPNHRPDRLLPNYTRCIVAEQRGNAVRALTSGIEEPMNVEQFAWLGGKWRTTARAQWWNDYPGEPAVLIGHYWRRRSKPDLGKFDYWKPFGPFGWAGSKKNVFCLDYSVGRRYLERARGVMESQFEGGLAAMRWPERVVLFDDREAPIQTA